ncbi:MAG: uncharacterized protein KVP18_000415 [Porospora cf. gigantea A]|uniref:uncharacterized protein n=1 Tax=Porospora cf. gigantea A TaxID=2853593 RepID=UPI003559BF64|nr:MAG: hypothetical protein KVP18_000415 [Porospora cf. gigantea A]
MAISSLIARRQLKLDFDDSVRRSGRRLEVLRVVAQVIWCVLLATVPTPHSFLSRVVVLLSVAALFECGVFFFKRQAKPVLYRRRVLLLGMLVQLAALGLLAAFPEEGRPPVSFSDSQAENPLGVDGRTAQILRLAVDPDHWDTTVSTDTVSVVIPVRNEEEWIHKTVKYTMQATPADMLLEIIVIDDASRIPVEHHLKNQLTAAELAKVQVIRLDEPNGLIRARILGADVALAPNIFFMDGHCRPYEGWLPPLLKHLKLNYKRIACPAIYDIDRYTWAQKGTSGAKMMFDWTFEFGWQEDLTDEVPISAGGVLALTKKWWVQSGRYDPGMLEWGGENLEQSMRCWMCGGEIYAEKESKVGHIFDRPPKPDPNGDLVRQVQRNQKRVGRVWLDDYYKYMQEYHSIINTLDEGVGVEERAGLRTQLHCNSFQWFVNRFRNSFERNQLLKHQYHHIRHRSLRMCLSLVNFPDPAKGDIRSQYPYLTLQPCDPSNRMQQWQVVAGRRMLENHGGQKCLDNKGWVQGARTDSFPLSDRHAIAFMCDWNGTFQRTNTHQFWQFDAWEPRSSSADKIDATGTQREGFSGRIFTADTEVARSEVNGNDVVDVLKTHAQDPQSVCLAAREVGAKEYHVVVESCSARNNTSQEWVWLW